MQDLIQRLMAEGLTEQQASKAIEVIKNFTKEKFPMFGGAIDDLFDKYRETDDDILP